MSDDIEPIYVPLLSACGFVPSPSNKDPVECVVRIPIEGPADLLCFTEDCRGWMHVDFPPGESIVSGVTCDRNCGWSYSFKLVPLPTLPEHSQPGV
jgi:hypothetical protein